MSAPSGSAPSRHWDQVYDAKGAQQVSWFQPQPTVSLELIDGLLDRTDPVIDVGGGASPLVDRLLDRGHTDLTVLDVSAHALQLAQRRLGDRAQQVHWATADLLQWRPERRYMLWHDRAVFHFLTTPDEQARYRELATTSITPGGYLIIATFAADGPEQCSGLPVARHRPDDLAEQLGAAFTTLTTRREHHHTPTGAEQPFTWLLARRTDDTGQS
ncbi:MAG: methyltransferase domain-containing protein [Pseudonocardiaceae bacterium]|nr:methyltransferase domain-containing protein [Pseudonocardiaceae bacterium]